MKKLFILCITAVALIAFTLSFPTTNASAASSSEKAYVKKASLNVKAKRSNSSNTVGKLKSGQTVKVYSTSYEGWSKIKYKNTYGYVHMQNLLFAEPDKWSKGVKSGVIKRAIKNGHLEPGEKYKIKKSPGAPGYYQLFVEFDGQWYRAFTINCKSGWYHG
ncbi:SH3 domain-containing protein [Viridibacillus arvi]|uniref:SH3 domain-containing protein n=1 Tax=Viridibacillus arvi TaxID=263475 RepID=UPI0036E44031